MLDVPVGPGVTLEVLDWGGVGPPLVLLAGLGNTAHVFDDFAPRLTGRFRVLGITRRGFGASSPVTSGFGIDTLAADLVAVLDAMGIGRAVLAGHSFAGDEITAVALAHPRRVQGLIYLDAAHDRTALPSLAAAAPYPAPPGWKDDENPRTLDGWGRYLARSHGVAFPRDEVEALLERDSTGRLAPRAGDAAAVAAALAGIRAPAFGALTMPVLALFALPGGLEDLFPAADSSSPSDQQRARRVWEVYGWWEREEVRRFRRLVPAAEVVVLDEAHHFLFLDDPEHVARLVRAFR